ncbi:hypothetical protein N7533_011408 [Penicillium manginii]|uniref:uncharacterized protein n=1 Tax=Penicillium manginii TaxID=203109 RepID=UPI002548F2C2|nr:uncharacterized protein N7533_011408 [Penicillium manginii]KAJ5741999.1 hypothetical protein N7533_011408 [Penicillium manginii]
MAWFGRLRQKKSNGPERIPAGTSNGQSSTGSTLTSRACHLRTCGLSVTLGGDGDGDGDYGVSDTP